MADVPQFTKNELVLNEYASGHGDDPDTNNWKISFKPDGMYIVDDAGNEIGPLGSSGGGADENAVTSLIMAFG